MPEQRLEQAAGRFGIVQLRGQCHRHACCGPVGQHAQRLNGLGQRAGKACSLAASDNSRVRMCRRKTAESNIAYAVGAGLAKMQPTDDTGRMIWEEVVDSDRMCRYYGYLAQRLSRVSQVLAIGTVGATSGTVLTLLSRFPEWVPAVAAAAAAVASLTLVIGRYQDKAANSADIRRKLGEIGTDWKALWSDVYSRDDAELRAQWRSLARRQAAIIECAPSELPLSKSLARRSQQEADWYWAQRHAAS